MAIAHCSVQYNILWYETYYRYLNGGYPYLYPSGIVLEADTKGESEWHYYYCMHSITKNEDVIEANLWCSYYFIFIITFQIPKFIQQNFSTVISSLVFKYQILFYALMIIRDVAYSLLKTFLNTIEIKHGVSLVPEANSFG